MVSFLQVAQEKNQCGYEHYQHGGWGHDKTVTPPADGVSVFAEDGGVPDGTPAGY